MAKTAKVKKRQVTIHSRAARRAESPSINLDKSAKPAHTTRDSASPSRPSKINPHALAAKDAGIQKKTKKGTMTRAQRLRYQKGLERAEENAEKLELKRQKSLGSEKKIKERAKGWEDVNGVTVKKSKKTTAFDGLDEETEDKRKEREWVSDEEMDGNDLTTSEGVEAAKDEVKESGKQVEEVIPESVPLPVEVDELL
ncbi:Alb1-domain-containing protein [Pyrenochaeta sp. MPI-SDFR-AT-0127]|nr:Alb1-domain-containing protein [Pyrenochaeta sp. MPI-SDFR-AT-0127]